MLEDCINRGYIYFDFDNYSNIDNFFVKQPHKILEMLTHKKWSVRKESKDYKPKDNEYVIEFWSRNGIDGHFARTLKGFNSLQNSQNVKSGKITSYRIFKEE